MMLRTERCQNVPVLSSHIGLGGLARARCPVSGSGGRGTRLKVQPRSRGAVCTETKRPRTRATQDTTSHTPRRTAAIAVFRKKRLRSGSFHGSHASGFAPSEGTRTGRFERGAGSGATLRLLDHPLNGELGSRGWPPIRTPMSSVIEAMGISGGGSATPTGWRRRLARPRLPQPLTPPRWLLLPLPSTLTGCSEGRTKRMATARERCMASFHTLSFSSADPKLGPASPGFSTTSMCGGASGAPY